mmetsp:Transcript_34191/g.65841  ORF Transcript_34191/g.65841 Transcript_34191/m.65841 type:complete len:81 (-) Transcript_34191:590-832(-)
MDLANVACSDFERSQKRKTPKETTMTEPKLVMSSMLVCTAASWCPDVDNAAPTKGTAYTREATDACKYNCQASFATASSM